MKLLQNLNGAIGDVVTTATATQAGRLLARTDVADPNRREELSNRCGRMLVECHDSATLYRRPSASPGCAGYGRGRDLETVRWP